MPQGTAIVIGGAEDKVRDRVILGRFVALAGGPDAKIAVLSTASSFGVELGTSSITLTGEAVIGGHGYGDSEDSWHVIVLAAEEGELTGSFEASGEQSVFYGDYWEDGSITSGGVFSGDVLAPEIDAAIEQGDLIVSSVISGNRNFEGRVHAKVRANYLASPPLVVAYALAGDVNIDITKDALGIDEDGKRVFLKDVWPSSAEIQEVLGATINAAP